MTCAVQQLETLIIVSMSINVLLSLIVLALNGFVLYILHIKKIAVTAIDDSSIRFQEVIKAADFARMPIVGILLLAELVNIPYDEVVREYEKDSMERRAVVYSVFSKNSTIKRFIEDYPSEFIRKGYDGEELLLKQTTLATQTTMAPKAATQKKSASLKLDSPVAKQA